MSHDLVDFLTNENTPNWFLISIPILFLIAYFKSYRCAGLFGIFLLFIQSVPRTPTTLSNVFNFLTILQLCLLPFLLRGIKVPKIIFFILTFIIMSICETGISYGFDNDVMSEFRKALNFPFFYLIAYNLSKSEEDIRWLFLGATLGAFFQSCREILFVAVSPEKNDLNVIRTFQFIDAGMVIYPVCLILLKTKKIETISGVFIAIILIALIFTQTRSLWMPQAISILFLIYIYRKNIFKCEKGIKKYLVFGIPMLFFLFFHNKIISGVDVFNVFENGNAMNLSDSHGRTEDIRLAFGEWINGNVLWGNGLGYSADTFKYDYYESRGHVGYLAYLANMGIIGFFLYGILFPYQRYKEMITLLKSDKTKSFGAIMCLLLVFFVVAVGLSGSLLGSLGYVQVSCLMGAISGYVNFGEKWIKQSNKAVGDE